MRKVYLPSPLRAFFLMVFVTACSNNPTTSPVHTSTTSLKTATPSMISTTAATPTDISTPMTTIEPIGPAVEWTATPTQNPILSESCHRIIGDGAYAPAQSPEVCVYDYDFPLQRPIDPPGVNTVDVSYRYGSTQNGQREPHHGVEFINKAGIPVLAAADGKVIVAGLDDEVVYADETNFYGKLVIIQHQLQGIDTKIYTLYGHLLNINVVTGQEIRVGKKIGEVGLGGVAAGTHLHFEVRYGLNEYSSTRNPELWLQPIELVDGQKSAVLAGRFIKLNGESQVIDHIVLKRISAGEQDVLQNIYLSPYAEPKMIGQLPWSESFGAGDLQAGHYTFSFVYKRPVEFNLDILPGKLTFVTIWVK
jgi:hypothetical protein